MVLLGSALMPKIGFTLKVPHFEVNKVYLFMPYKVNPDRNVPWNTLPELPIDKHLYEDVEIYSQLGNAKAALGRLQGRSVVIPNQGLLINSISLQERRHQVR
ncbi:hypothetical protein GCM10028827_05020 [Mucilaginibacter myungsuensis]